MKGHAYNRFSHILYHDVSYQLVVYILAYEKSRYKKVEADNVSRMRMNCPPIRQFATQFPNIGMMFRALA